MIYVEDSEVENIKKALYTRLTLETLREDEKYGKVVNAILNIVDGSFCDFEKETIERIKNEKTLQIPS